MNKKFYVIYQVTNKINGKIYVGKHKTDDLADNYMGSGRRLKKDQQKYGLENFEMKVLFYLQNEDEMNLLERMVVNSEFLKRDDVYNVNEGGAGGWEYLNSKKLNMSGKWKNIGENSKRFFEQNGYYPGTRSRILKYESDSEFRKNYNAKISAGVKAHNQKYGCWWTGKQHSEETKQKIRDQHRKNGYQVGEKNSQFGMIAIYNETTFERAMQPKDQPVPAGWAKGRFYNATSEELQKRKAVVDQILRIRPESKANIRMKLPQLEKILNAAVGKTAKKIDKKESVKLKRISKERALAEKKKVLREMYLFYDKHGFAAMVEKFGYPYSSANFVQQCARHVPEYVSQNGKKRGV